MKRVTRLLFGVFIPLVLFVTLCGASILIGLNGDLPLASSYKYQDANVFVHMGH
jgi:hypothetical protein